MTGYLHSDYAASLCEFGAPRVLPRCEGWILERQIPDFSDRDAMTCYPLFACRDWSQLGADLEETGRDLVSLAVVTDPFGAYDVAYLRGCFQDVVRPFKAHFTIKLGHPLQSFVSRHHRRYARKALRNLEVEKCDDQLLFLDDWIACYATLIERHHIKGLTAFSRLAFTRQLQVPGRVMFRAVHEGVTVGILLWYIQNQIGYYHLGAYSPLGYELRTSFALFWTAIEYFTDLGLQWLNLGAGAGVTGEGTDGLSRFKQGWSTGTRTAYFCGRIFCQPRYREITQAKGLAENGYFPAYRQGEFG